MFSEQLLVGLSVLHMAVNLHLTRVLIIKLLKVKALTTQFNFIYIQSEQIDLIVMSLKSYIQVSI